MYKRTELEKKLYSLGQERAKLMKLKNRSHCPICDSNLSKAENRLSLNLVNQEIEAIEIKMTKEFVEKNIAFWKQFNSPVEKEDSLSKD